MKTIRIFSFFALLFAITQTAFSQELKTETFAVSAFVEAAKRTLKKRQKMQARVLLCGTWTQKF